jgi:hypothetical protein
MRHTSRDCARHSQKFAGPSPPLILSQNKNKPKTKTNFVLFTAQTIDEKEIIIKQLEVSKVIKNNKFKQYGEYCPSEG